MFCLSSQNPPLTAASSLFTHMAAASPSRLSSSSLEVSASQQPESEDQVRARLSRGDVRRRRSIIVDILVSLLKLDWMPPCLRNAYCKSQITDHAAATTAMSGFCNNSLSVEDDYIYRSLFLDILFLLKSDLVSDCVGREPGAGCWCCWPLRGKSDIGASR